MIITLILAATFGIALILVIMVYNYPTPGPIFGILGLVTAIGICIICTVIDMEIARNSEIEICNLREEVAELRRACVDAGIATSVPLIQHTEFKLITRPITAEAK